MCRYICKTLIDINRRQINHLPLDRNEKRQFRKSINLIRSICIIQAIDIEDTVYMIMIGMNKLNLTDTHSYFEGASN